MTEELRHTPGPWWADLEHPFTLDGDMVDVCAMTPDLRYVKREVASCLLSTEEYPDGEDWLEDIANVRLIAAAPDLLAAARAVLRCLDGDHGQAEGQQPNPLAVIADRDISKKMLRDAVAKALLFTGREGEAGSRLFPHLRGDS